MAAKPSRHAYVWYSAHTSKRCTSTLAQGLYRGRGRATTTAFQITIIIILTSASKRAAAEKDAYSKVIVMLDNRAHLKKGACVAQRVPYDEA